MDFKMHYDMLENDVAGYLASTKFKLININIYGMFSKL